MIDLRESEGESLVVLFGVATPSPWLILPFIVLLGMIALGPLAFHSWWEKHYGKVAIGLGLLVAAYYAVVLREPGRLASIAHEYISFIAIIGALYVIAGGIHIKVKGEATPSVNVAFLLAGAILANFLGTTGASMLLIRPWIRMNKYRVTMHHIVFFIFIVSNVGGALTPIGDPPLFMGYLYGIPFWWVAEHCWPMWATGLAFLLGLFWVVDRQNYLKAPAPVRASLAEPPDDWTFDGLRNLVFLAVILGAVFIEKPSFLREGIMIAAAIASWGLTPKYIHDSNHFTFHPLKEVALLFVGIFATMIPALDWLGLHAGEFARGTPGFFYWSTGTLSGVLDNAPTYLSFLTSSFGLFITDDMVREVAVALQNGVASSQSELIQHAVGYLHRHHGAGTSSLPVEEIKVALLLANPAWAKIVESISVGAVFFGAATYIGNGPNFMVKAIATQSHCHTPSFFGYILKFTLPCLLPMLLLVWFLFFRR